MLFLLQFYNNVIRICSLRKFNYESRHAIISLNSIAIHFLYKVLSKSGYKFGFFSLFFLGGIRPRLFALRKNKQKILINLSIYLKNLVEIFMFLFKYLNLVLPNKEGSVAQ